MVEEHSKRVDGFSEVVVYCDIKFRLKSDEDKFNE